MEKSSMPTPRYKPTDETRALIQRCVVAGFDEATIAICAGIGETTLKKYYAKELRESANRANAAVVGALYKNAMEGNVSAQIFWCKTRLCWRETDRLEVTAADGANLIPVININVKKA
jgi:rhamnogalacturonyl hydrolase YesR